MIKSIKNDFRQKGNVWTSHNVVIAVFYMHENLFLLFFVEEKLSLKMGHRVKIKFFAFYKIFDGVTICVYLNLNFEYVYEYS